VRENYTTTRTAYRTECRQEAYTAYRCELVPETKTRVVTCYHRVPETRTEVRTVCEYVSAMEERTCMKPCWSTVTETVMTCKKVDRGHYECREVYSHRKAMQNRLHSLCHRNDCCEPCLPPPCKTVKTWCPCWVTEQCPVTRCKKVCTMVPEKVCVKVCRPVTRQVTCQVCSYRCVAEQKTETYTCCVSRQVAVPCTRTVRVCVPYQETVTCCRMVPRTVCRTVPCPVADCCSAACCCEQAKCHRRFSFAGLRHHHESCDSCGSSCSSCGTCH